MGICFSCVFQKLYKISKHQISVTISYHLKMLCVTTITKFPCQLHNSNKIFNYGNLSFFVIYSFILNLLHTWSCKITFSSKRFMKKTPTSTDNFQIISLKWIKIYRMYILHSCGCISHSEKSPEAFKL